MPIDFGDAKSIEKRTTTAVNHPDTIRDIIDYITNGGSMIEWCDDNNVRFFDMMSWINRDELRRKLYDQAVVDRSEFLIQRILKEFKNLALVNVQDIFDEDGVLKDIKKIDRITTSAISKIETFEEYDKKGNYLGRTRKITMSDKLPALKELAALFKIIPQELLVRGKIEHVYKVDKFDLDERIKKELNKNIAFIEASNIVNEKPNT